MQAVEQLVQTMSSRFDRDTCRQIVQKVMEREHEFGTAVGDGVAIPHLRLECLTAPVLAFGRSVEGIDWNSPDGGHVHYVFLLASPTSTADLHLQILSAIGRALSREDNRRRISEARSAADLYGLLTEMLSAKKPGKL